MEDDSIDMEDDSIDVGYVVTLHTGAGGRQRAHGADVPARAAAVGTSRNRCELRFHARLSAGRALHPQDDGGPRRHRELAHVHGGGLLTLVHFSAQPEPFLSLQSTENTQLAPKNVLTSSQQVGECKALVHGAHEVPPASGEDGRLGEGQRGGAAASRAAVGAGVGRNRRRAAGARGGAGQVRRCRLNR